MAKPVDIIQIDESKFSSKEHLVSRRRMTQLPLALVGKKVVMAPASPSHSPSRETYI